MSKSRGRFGIHGGQYIPETLMNAVIELEQAYRKYKEDPDFVREFNEMLATYVGRPSLWYYADRMTKDLGGAKIYLKREDLNHTGSHKLNNALGQALLAKRMGKKRLIAETGAGPEHAHLYDVGRAKYVPVTDDEAVDAFEYLSRIEGIIPAIESAHAVAYAKKIVPQMDKDEIVVITLSGRGDKDCAAIARYRGEDIHE